MEDDIKAKIREIRVRERLRKEVADRKKRQAVEEMRRREMDFVRREIDREVRYECLMHLTHRPKTDFVFGSSTPRTLHTAANGSGDANLPKNRRLTSSSTNLYVSGDTSIPVVKSQIRKWPSAPSIRCRDIGPIGCHMRKITPVMEDDERDKDDDDGHEVHCEEVNNNSISTISESSCGLMNGGHAPRVNMRISKVKVQLRHEPEVMSVRSRKSSSSSMSSESSSWSLTPSKRKVNMQRIIELSQPRRRSQVPSAVGSLTTCRPGGRATPVTVTPTGLPVKRLFDKHDLLKNLTLQDSPTHKYPRHVTFT